MRRFKHIVIGFGKGGKTLSAILAAAGEDVALVERSAMMYGGACPNVACIPTKMLEHSARLSAVQGGGFEDRAARYRDAVEEKRRLTAGLRENNYKKAVGAGVTVITGEASFLDPHRIQVKLAEGGIQELYGEYFYLDTGAVPAVPPIEGLKQSSHVYTSETMMELDRLPRRLAVIGGGYNGLEFASFYANFGSEVTVLHHGKAFMPKEEEEISQAVLKEFAERGIRVVNEAETLSVQDENDGTVLTVRTSEKIVNLKADAVLIAAGRRPNTDMLNLEAAGVELNGRNAVRVDSQLKTSVPHIWAMGDVKGGLQFTYISLDDSRIIKSQLLGNGGRTTENRGAIPYSIFLDPPVSRVGMTEKEARAAGLDIKTAVLPAAAIPKAKALGKTAGILKAVVDRQTGLILGAHLYCAESHEMINLFKIAIDAGIPYTVLRDGIYNHPVMSEGINDLFAEL